MTTPKFDVIIVGAGPAGVAAAGALAGSGISVALIEAGVYAGSENWSGCVYFTENLAEPDCFGPAAVQSAPFERQVVRRGTILHNGIDAVGVTMNDPALFPHCYTVLRPVYDPYFAALARGKGATLLTGITVTALIRRAGRVIGLSTNRGPLYGDIVFIAEGDASHLVRSEGLEQTRDPHFLQGVKAVLSLPPREIEDRFHLGQGEGAAYEVLLRNPALGGRTAALNLGGFLYTNRDSLSLGYVVPLDNLRKQYRGDHGRLFDWMRSLPMIGDLTAGAKLSAYGAKLIRSGGWRERPALVEDGLAVGGASACLGIDIPFPNFTGPASATGLYFARAVKSILKDGHSPDARNLRAAYLDPLMASVYGRNARSLSRWPGYFSRSRVLFGRTADLACGSARFLADRSMTDFARFLRGHLLSPRALTGLVADSAAMVGGLRLWKPLIMNVLHPAAWTAWALNMFRRTPPDDGRLDVFLASSGEKRELTSLRWPVGPLLKRLRPALSRTLSLVYGNDARPMDTKLAEAVRTLMRSFRATDLAVLPAYALFLFLSSAAAALFDAFRYYVLKTPAGKLLAEPAMAYGQAQRKARDLDAVRPDTSIEARLATNTYRVGSVSHIRTLWPDRMARHSDMASAGIWWVCPARVYGYDAPPAGRGSVAVNWENCIKCESCWRAEPGFALWGRFTDHGLIYRPATAAIPLLLDAQRSAGTPPPPTRPGVIDKQMWYATPAMSNAARKVLAAGTAFLEAVAALPASADQARISWPVALGERLCRFIALLEGIFHADGRHDAAVDLADERKAVELRIREGRLFHALACARRIEHRLHAWMPQLSASVVPEEEAGTGRPAAPAVMVAYEEASRLLPDRVVKEWEEQPMPEEWSSKLNSFIAGRRASPQAAVRALSAVSPALGLIAARRLLADRLLQGKLATPPAGICAVVDEDIALTESGGGFAVSGILHLVPTAASTALLVVSGGKGFIIPFGAPGVVITPTPAIGFRAAGLADVKLSCTIERRHVIELGDSTPGHDLYLAIALGAGDYLSRRAREYAVGRVQFPGQMLDTQGRDGIAKLGAVKALVARVEAWRLLLEALYDLVARLTPDASRELGPLCSALAARAFGPEQGCMAYDAGQVFGGFAYSEDDLLSRSYRDSSLFPFLTPGYGSAVSFGAFIGRRDLASLLVPQLGDLDALTGMPLSPLAGQWRETARSFSSLPGAADPAAAGAAAALLLGIRSLLDRVEQGLVAGRGREADAASIEVLLGLAADAVMEASLSAGRGTVSPSALFPMEPGAERLPLDPDYGLFRELPGAPHRSGTFLRSAFDRSPRYVPEMQLHDRDLQPLWSELVSWFKLNCRDRAHDGLPFERAVERIHDLPGPIIAAVKEHKWLATYIPPSEDGLGWSKARYFVLNSAAGSFGDAAICLLIMASTSIGTTPVLLGLEDELPRVREELEPLARDPALLGEIGSLIRRITASFENPDPGRIRKQYEAAMALVDSRIRRTRVVKYLAANFLRAFYGAGIAGRRGDYISFKDNLLAAAGLFDHLMPEVLAALEELPRRERCHRLFLRNLGHGGVSAFALTEPTAGSDSGGVKTNAVIRIAALSALPDGRYSFSPTGEPDKCLRYLIDADRIVFTGEGMAYLPPDGKPAVIRYDRYDYRTDEGARYYEYNGSICEFHDIGQMRSTDKGLIYEYYSLTGAKMWITNGGIATQFSLFAHAPEGVTGFMVDRHAEGLKVGADERKMGQRGSPTNEISLDGVRVPREAVIGYEGHGQVNALETLNAGRCGLAVVAGALVRKVLAEAAAAIPPSEERDLLLGEAAAIQFGSESVAYYLIGLFDRPHESVRMESAIAKFLCSEDLHEILALVERAYGPAGQTERYFVEKARRDARILTIYEGTNEVQRFLVLKDLISLAADWPVLPERIPERPADTAMATLARWKNRVGAHVRSAAAALGDTAWMDAMLQPGLFVLSEMAGEVLRLECVWYRMEWLCARSALVGGAYVDALTRAGQRAADRTVARLEHLERKFSAVRQRIDQGLDLPEVRAADALFDSAAGKPARPAAKQEGQLPRRILCILRPVADLPPDPALDRGRLREIVWMADPLDRAALDHAAALRAAGEGSVTVDALLIGGSEHEDILRSAGAAVDGLIRLDCDHAGPGAVAGAVRSLEQSSAYDLIACGSRALDGDGGLAPFLAGFLHKDLSVSGETAAGNEHDMAGTVLAVDAADRRTDPDVTSLIGALQKEVRVLRPAAVPEPLRPVFSRPAASVAATRTIATVEEAAAYLKAYAAALKASTADAYEGAVGPGELPRSPAVWVLTDAAGGKANISSLRTARTAGDLFGKSAFALIAAPRAAWPGLVGLARAHGSNAAYCLDTGKGTLSLQGMLGVLERMTRTAEGSLIVATSGWNNALAMTAGRSAHASIPVPLVLNCTGIEKDPAGHLAAAVPAYDGRLVRWDRIPDGTAFLSVADGAVMPEAAAGTDFTASAIDLQVLPEWTAPPLPEQAPSLSAAEVIIDVGYGIRDRSGFDLARELRKKLEDLGLAPLFGATRKVTQDLKLLPLDAQIGQTGVRVNPKLIIALGISGAPQHIDWIGSRAEVLCFNKDPEAPLMNLNDSRPAPRVHPIPGDLFVTVRELIAKL